MPEPDYIPLQEGSLEEWADEHGIEHVRPQGSDLYVGVEIEYPMSYEPDTTFRRPGQYSGNIRDEMQRDYGGRREYPGGTIDRDGTAGLELTSRASYDTERLFEWFCDAIAELHNDYAAYEPCGISGPGGGSTFGQHLHISPLTRDEARGLYELSMEPWFRTFACSSVVNSPTEEEQRHNTYQVFRRSYCGMSFNDETRGGNQCVTLCEWQDSEHERGHWEWRLLEPITPEHFGIVMRFIELLRQEGPEEAGNYARTFVANACPALTAFRRAEACNLIEEEDDRNWSLSRVPYEGTDESEELYQDLVQSPFTPYVYQVRCDDESYYGFYSESHDDDYEFPAVHFDEHLSVTDVIDAETLELVDDDETADNVRDYLELRRAEVVDGDGGDKTEETDVLEIAMSEPDEATEEDILNV